MKKLFIAIAIVSAGFATISCRETETKEVVREVEVKVETSDDDAGILERAAKKADEKINEEINEEIEKIGDDQ